MKELLINALFHKLETGIITPATLGELDKIRILSNSLRNLRLHDENIALVSSDKNLQIYFQIACLLRGVNYTILDLNRLDEGIDEYIITSLNIKVLYFDSKNYDLQIPEYLFKTTFIISIVDTSTFNIHMNTNNIEVESDIREFRAFKNKYNENISKYLVEFESLDAIFKENLKNPNILKTIREIFLNETVSHRDSIIYVIHPGNSSYGNKISVFNAERFLQGFVNVLDTLPTKRLSIYTKENVAIPYIFNIGVLLTLFESGKIITEIDKIKNTKVSHILMSSVSLMDLLMEIIENNATLSFLYKYKFTFVFNYLLKRKFKQIFNTMPVLLLYGKVSNRLLKFLKSLGIEVFYFYVMVEIASFVSFKHYKKIKSLNPLSVGKLPRGGILNGKDINGNSELLINLKDQFISYTNLDFTELCIFNEKHLGFHSTFDICSEVNGELFVEGKAEELLINQNGLVIQNNLIYTILLSNIYVEDCLVVFDNINDAKAVSVLVELRLSSLLFHNKTSIEVLEDLNSNVLPLLQKKVLPYVYIDRIIQIPGGFERDNDGKIKISRYL